MQKQKYIVHLLNHKYVAIFNYNLIDPSKSEIYNKRFTDLCNFEIDYASFVVNHHIRKDFTYNLNRNLLVIIESNAYNYTFSTNEMKSLESLKLSHEGGSIIYCNYDECIYVIGGKETDSVERIFYDKENEIFGTSWELTQSINEIRYNFISFLVNEKIIYIALGIEGHTGTFSTTIKKLDTSLLIEGWTQVKLDLNKSPKIINAGCIPLTNDSILILGGTKPNKKINASVYIYKYFTSEWSMTDFSLETTKINIKTEENNSFGSGYSNLREFDHKNLDEVDPSAVFSSRNTFLPLKFGPHHTNTFYFSQFDNACCCHLINVKTFDHIMFSNNPEDYNDNNYLNNNNLQEDFNSQKESNYTQGDYKSGNDKNYKVTIVNEKNLDSEILTTTSVIPDNELNDDNITNKPNITGIISK